MSLGATKFHFSPSPRACAIDHLYIIYIHIYTSHAFVRCRREITKRGKTTGEYKKEMRKKGVAGGSGSMTRFPARGANLSTHGKNWIPRGRGYRSSEKPATRPPSRVHSPKALGPFARAWFSRAWWMGPIGCLTRRVLIIRWEQERARERKWERERASVGEWERESKPERANERERERERCLDKVIYGIEPYTSRAFESKGRMMKCPWRLPLVQLFNRGILPLWMLGLKKT